MQTATRQQTIIRMRGICTRFGATVIHEDIDLDVQRGEILALVGGSGSGKTTLLQEMILLRRPQAGSIQLFGEDILDADAHRLQSMRRRFGVLFQHGALFSSHTVLGNVGFVLREHTTLPDKVIDELSMLKIQQAGLPADAAGKYPRQLSGGMVKRAALARAMALDPDILFLDEPTSGLDPASAGAFDDLVARLRELLGLTIVMVTHDLDSLWQVADRVALLGDRRLLAIGSMAALSENKDPGVLSYFHASRGRNAFARSAPGGNGN